MWRKREGVWRKNDIVAKKQHLWRKNNICGENVKNAGEKKKKKISTVLASVKALNFLHRVRIGGLPTRGLLEDGLITYLEDDDNTDSSERGSPQSDRNSRKRVNDLGQEPGIPASLFQIPKNRQKKKIRFS